MRLLLFIILCFFSANTSGQDIHFSQFKNAKLNLNPALSASIESDFQAVLQRRSQWGSITDPFKTISLSLKIERIFTSSPEKIPLYFNHPIKEFIWTLRRTEVGDFKSDPSKTPCSY